MNSSKEYEYKKKIEHNLHNRYSLLLDQDIDNGYIRF